MTRARYFEVATDQSGRPIPGVIVAVYQTGTTTPIVETIYSAATGAGTLTNPLTSNSQGEVEFFLAVPARVDLAWSKSRFTAETHQADVLAADAFVLATEKAAANGVATLDGTGLLSVAQLPPLSITDSFVVASQAAMLALTAQRGDVAIRSDLSKTFILAADPASVLANWLLLATPVDSVLSVDGLTGTVVLPADGAVGVATKRTLGAGAVQAAAGNHAHAIVSPGIIRPIAGLTATVSVHPQTTFAAFSRFTVPIATSYRYGRTRIGVQSGNFQLAVASIVENAHGVVSGTGFAYTRLMDSGIIACPAAEEVIIDLGATVLPAGEYIIWQWLSDTTATVPHVSGRLVLDRMGGNSAPAGGLAASGFLAWSDRACGAALEQT